ncbi:protein white-like [Lytechinus variegatus]|uniref:protein white-like n=1 Tax=Lytechinus variegatus TaxID=7654 RepID=UPI001BB2264D|nr:protein white-like [Lytechinus variegatus]XP_041462640.1 protein white-like [Lytechinus variegatus]
MDQEIRLGVIPADQRITLSWSNINVTFTPGRGLLDKVRGRPSPPSTRILKEVSGVAKPGRLMALMGASGAGKTTLLNVLTNRGISDLEVTGNVLLNGQRMSELGPALNELIGYVQQNDILPPTLTVREYLVFTGTMTMYKRLTSQQIYNKVDELLTQFSMLDCADSLIDVGTFCISGSERKRLSVACKLFGERRLLFLDEPTTGLDSYVAQLLIGNLRSLADLGYNIVCTIHQPSSQVFNMFDQLFLLADGRCVYFGEREEAVPYFSVFGYTCPDTFSPADYLIDLLAIKPGRECACLDRVESIANAFSESTMAKTVHDLLCEEYERVGDNESIHLESSVSKSKQAPRMSQFIYLFWRCSIGLWRYPLLILLRFLLITCACVLLMVIYVHPDDTYTESRANGIQGLLFFMSSFFIIFNSLLILSVLPSDLPLIVREHRDGLYHLSSYYITTFLVQSIIGSCFMIASTCAVYFVVGLKKDPQTFFSAMGILIIVFLINVGFAALVSAIYETAGNTVSQSIPLVFLSNVLGGYFCLLGSIPHFLDPLLYINWLPWGYEMLSINQWRGVELECTNTSCLTGDDVLHRWGLDKNAFEKNFILILFQLAGYHVVAFIILSLKMRFKWSG